MSPLPGHQQRTAAAVAVEPRQPRFGNLVVHAAGSQPHCWAAGLPSRHGCCCCCRHLLLVLQIRLRCAGWRLLTHALATNLAAWATSSSCDGLHSEGGAGTHRSCPCCTFFSAGAELSALLLRTAASARAGSLGVNIMATGDTPLLSKDSHCVVTAAPERTHRSHAYPGADNVNTGSALPGRPLPFPSAAWPL